MCSCSLLSDARSLGRNQLFETVKRCGAGSLSGVVKPRRIDAVHRPVAGLGHGRRREHNHGRDTEDVLGVAIQP